MHLLGKIADPGLAALVMGSIAGNLLCLFFDLVDLLIHLVCLAVFCCNLLPLIPPVLEVGRSFNHLGLFMLVRSFLLLGFPCCCEGVLVRFSFAHEIW